jgi:ABC-type maltose transport system permease subunit
MSCWTLNLLELMIALFYLMHIMLKKCFKKKFEHFYYLPISTPYNSYLVKNYGDGVLQEKYAQMIGSYIP